ERLTVTVVPNLPLQENFRARSPAIRRCQQSARAGPDQYGANTMSNPISSSFQPRAMRAPLLIIGTASLLAGCAGTPPTEQMAVSQSLVESAVSAGGPEYAAVEMRSAREKYQQAEMAMQEHDYTR